MTQAPARGTTTGAARSRPWLAGGVLLLLTALAYLPVLRAGYVWDDDDWLTDNRTIRAAGGLRQIWLSPRASIQYYPLTFTSWWLDYRVWGTNPLPYHVENVLLHAASVVLLWRILRRLAVPGAWLAAALFALHPVHVESVAWITERKNVLSGVFYFAAAWCYLRFERDFADPAPPRSWGWYGPAILLFAAALLSKTVTATLPAALLVVAWWKLGRLRPRHVAALAPLFVLGLAFGLLTAQIERTTVGAAGTEWSLTALERIVLAGRAVWFYLGKLLWPLRLSFLYDQWQLDARQAWQFLAPVAVIAVLVVLWVLRRRVGRAPLAAGLFFVLTLAPALGFFNVYFMRYAFVADHFQYLASVGPLVGAAALLALRLPRPARAGVAGVILLALGVLTWRQASVYHNEETLWRDALAKTPDGWMAANNLSHVLLARGALDEALPLARRARELRPHHPEPLTNLGSIHAARGEPDLAIACFEEALRCDPQNSEARNNLGLALAGLGRFAEAARHYSEALRLRPDHALIQANLARALLESGRVDEAIEGYRRALALEPTLARERMYLGMALLRSGRLAEGAAELEQVVRQVPQAAEAKAGLATAWAQQGRLNEAAALYEEALRLNPNLAEAHQNLANTLVSLARADEARTHYLRALELRPNYADAHYGLALVDWQDSAAAAEHLRRAIELRPDQPDFRCAAAQLLLAAGRVESAITELAHAVRVAPRHARSWQLLAGALQRSGRGTEALEAYRTAIELTPCDAELRCDFGDALAAAGRPSESRREYEQALRLDPQSRRARAALAPTTPAP